MISFSNTIGGRDKQSAGSLYQQLQRALRDAIANERIASDEALPPERDLAEEFGIPSLRSIIGEQ